MKIIIQMLRDDETMKQCS